MKIKKTPLYLLKHGDVILSRGRLLKVYGDPLTAAFTPGDSKYGLATHTPAGQFQTSMVKNSTEYDRVDGISVQIIWALEVAYSFFPKSIALFKVFKSK